MRHPDLGGRDFANGAGQFGPVAMVGDDERQFDAALLGALADEHPPGSKGCDRLGEAPRPAVGKGRRRPEDDRAGEILPRLAFKRGRAKFAEVDALALIIFAQSRQRTVDMDRLVITLLAQQRDQPLRLAERVSADDMGTFGKLLQRCEKPGGLGPVVWMVEDRQAEGRLGNEDITGDRFEGPASRVGAALVIAGDDDPLPTRLDRDLGGAEHMTGRME